MIAIWSFVILTVIFCGVVVSHSIIPNWLDVYLIPALSAVWLLSITPALRAANKLDKQNDLAIRQVMEDPENQRVQRE